MNVWSDDRFMTIADDDGGADQLVGMLRDMVVAIVRGEEPDLSVRQLGVLLACYLDEDRMQTTCSLMRALRCSRRSINRALVRLEELDLVALDFDPQVPTDLNVHTTGLGRRFVDRLLEPARQSSRVLEHSLA